MRMPRQARRLPALSTLITGSVLAPARVAGHCVWEFGNRANGRTFGRDEQYGTAGPGTMGAFAGRVRPQPSC